MKNYKQPGKNVTLPVPTDFKSGEPVVVGEIAGVMITDEKDGEGTIRREGIFDLSVVATGALTFGSKLYHDGTLKSVTDDPTGNTFFGLLFGTVAGASTVTKEVLIG